MKKRRPWHRHLSIAKCLFSKALSQHWRQAEGKHIQPYLLTNPLKIKNGVASLHVQILSSSRALSNIPLLSKQVYSMHPGGHPGGQHRLLHIPQFFAITWNAPCMRDRNPSQDATVSVQCEITSGSEIQRVNELVDSSYNCRSGEKNPLEFTLTADFATAGIHSQCQSTFLTAFYRPSCELGLTLHWMLMIHLLITVRKSTESAFIDYLR